MSTFKNTAAPIARFGKSGPGLELYEYLPRLEEYLEEAFGPPVYALRTGVDTAPRPPTREQVRATLTADGFSGAALDKAEGTTILELRKVYLRRKEEHEALVGKAFAAILNTLTVQGKEAVRSHEKFPAARASDNLVLLRAIVEETHDLTRGVGTSETAQQLRHRYHQLRQRTDQSLYSVYSEFAHILASLERAGDARLTQRERARDFIELLDDTRFGIMKVTLARNRAAAASNSTGDPDGIYPATLPAALSYAQNWERERLEHDGGTRAPRAARTGTAMVAESSRAAPVQQHHRGPRQDPARRGRLQRQSAPQRVHFPPDIRRRIEGQQRRPDTRPPDNHLRGHGTAVLTVQEALSEATLGVTDPDDDLHVLIDSGASHSVFRNGTILGSVKACTPVDITGVGGIRTVSLQGTYGAHLNVLYCPEAPANILSVSAVMAAYGATATFSAQEAVIMFPSGERICGARMGGLYVVHHREAATVLHATVSANAARFTAEQRRNATKAHRALEVLGFPSARDLADATRTGSIAELGITAQDVIRAGIIYGRHAADIAGKTTARAVQNSPEETIGVIEVAHQTLHVDIAFEDGVPGLIGVAKPLNVMLYSDLADNYTAASTTAAINDMAATLEARGFQIAKVVIDSDTRFGELRYPTERVAAGSHVSVAERAIRTIKERCRAVRASLPFSIPRQTARELVKYCVSLLNLFSSPGDGDPRSPRERATGIRPSMRQLRDLRFGDYVQVPNIQGDITRRSTVTPRTVGAIALRPTFNRQGAWYFARVDSGEVVTRASWIPLPTPADVIDRINALSMGRHRLPVAIRPSPPPDNEEPTATSPAEPTAVPADRVDADAPPSAPEQPPSEAADNDEEPDSEHEQQLRRSTRIAERMQAAALHVTLRKALETFGTPGLEAVRRELGQLLRRRVWTPVPRGTRTSSAPLPCQLFLREKVDAEGRVIRVKGRLVAGGHRQYRGTDDHASPTVATEALLTIIGIAGAQGHDFASMDVEAAYLEVDIDREMYMRLGPDIATHLLDMDPSYAEHRNPDGSIVVQLRKALYGTLQAAKLWYRRLSSVLTEDGFIENPYDACVFHKREDARLTLITVHVDDLLVTSSTPEGVDRVRTLLLSAFENVNVMRGQVDYLGMRLERHKGNIRLSMNGYITDCINEAAPVFDGKEQTAPAKSSLFEDDERSAALDADTAEKFHSLTAKLLYAAKRTRPDILTAVTYLCGKVSCPNATDLEKLKHLLGYIKRTKQHCIDFHRDRPVLINAYVDASYAPHDDGRSHGGLVIEIAGGCVCAISKKQTIVTKSSTEAELVAISDASNYILWLRQLIEIIGFKMPPTVIYEDNRSTLHLLESDKTHRKRSRHINARFFFIRDRVETGECTLVHLPGEDMVADLMTKPVEGPRLRRLCSGMMCVDHNA
jgi:hypothetical protein